MYSSFLTHTKYSRRCKTSANNVMLVLWKESWVQKMNCISVVT